MSQMDDYQTLVEKAGRFHGDICAGIAIGTRMTMSGLQHIGIADPLGEDRKKLIVFVEIDRCATDAIMALTGCRPGKRTMKIRDFGKMAATFINIETGRAVRVATAAKKNDGDEQQDYGTMPEQELFTIEEVEVPLCPEDLPGRPLSRVTCESCGESVMDGREFSVYGRQLCGACADEKSRYYRRK